MQKPVVISERTYKDIRRALKLRYWDLGGKMDAAGRCSKARAEAASIAIAHALYDGLDVMALAEGIKVTVAGEVGPEPSVMTTWTDALSLDCDQTGCYAGNSKEYLKKAELFDRLAKRCREIAEFADKELTRIKKVSA